MTVKTVPAWRSMLFVPADNERFVVGAARRGADAIILDLEDSILPGRKAEARRLVLDAARTIGAGGPAVTVRINQPLRLSVPDVEAVVSEHVAAIVVPKVIGPDHLLLIDSLLTELEIERRLDPGKTGIVAMIETPAALPRMAEIASCPRVIGLSVGAEDLSTSMGMIPSPDSLYVPNVLAVAAARSNGCLPIGYLASVASLEDLDALRGHVRRSKNLGLAAGMCIHPDQVPVLNEEFSPSSDEIAEAEAVLSAFADAERKGIGAARHQGRMIDKPMVDRAREILKRTAFLDPPSYGGLS